MKECFKCHQRKPLTEFYCHERMADGHLNKCKTCTRIDTRIHRALNDVRYAEYDRERNQKEYHRRDRAHRKRRYRREYPERFAANGAVYRAVRAGRLKRPSSCEGCGRETALHAHHEDYGQPLNVVWLCARCHAVHHHVRSFFGDAAREGATRG